MASKVSNKKTVDYSHKGAFTGGRWDDNGGAIKPAGTPSAYVKKKTDKKPDKKKTDKK